MRRTVLAVLAAVVLLLGGSPAIAAPPERPDQRPACADIVEFGGKYQPSYVPGEPGRYSPQLALAGPSCPGVTYTIYVLDNDGFPVVLASQSVRGDRSDVVEFADMDILVDDGDPSVCVYATSAAGNHVFDRNPGEGCLSLEATPCAVITKILGKYEPSYQDGIPGIYSPVLVLAAEGCPEITYTVHVLDGDEEDAVDLGSQSVEGYRSGLVQFDDIPIAVTSDDRAICVYATASDGDRIVHRSPAEGCVMLEPPPACADIRGIGGHYVLADAPAGPNQLYDPALELAAPSCPGITYTYEVFDDTAQELGLTSQSVPGDGSDVVHFDDMAISISDGDPAICVYGTSRDGRQVLDREPVSGCLMLGTTTPPCADIQLIGGRYDVSDVIGGPGRYFPKVHVAEPSCVGMTYTIHVLDSAEPGAFLLGSQSVLGDGSDDVNFPEMDLTVRDGDTTVCAYATSSQGDRVFDRLPVEGCAESQAIDIRDYWWFP